ncbi:MAG TPA: zinc metalloprotease HtpX [Armatimonadota bacterium]|jgi:heat shock protein HtpX
MNGLKTTLLLGGLTGLLLVIGQALGGQQGMAIALVFAAVGNFAAYWFSDKMVLAQYRAQEVGPSDAPQLYHIVEGLCRKANLPMPKVYIVPDQQPNAFATGRDPDHAAVACTEGILRILGPEELEAVLAHELSHVRNRDILISSIAATIGGAISFVAQMAQWGMMFGGYGGRDDDDRGGNPIVLILTMITAPIAAMVIQMAISRSREFQADESGARLCGRPLALASALQRLERGAETIPMDASPSTAHMFIVNPLTGGGGLAGLFRTHPSTEDRVRRLQAIASDLKQASYS